MTREVALAGAFDVARDILAGRGTRTGRRRRQSLTRQQPGPRVQTPPFRFPPGAFHVPPERQWETSRHRRRSGDALVMGASRQPGSDGHQVRLRHLGLWCLHRAHQRPADALLRHTDLERERCGHDDRGRVRRSCRQGGAGCLGQAGCRAMRLLPVGSGDGGDRAAEEQEESRRTPISTRRCPATSVAAALTRASALQSRTRRSSLA